MPTLASFDSRDERPDSPPTPLDPTGASPVTNAALRRPRPRQPDALVFFPHDDFYELFFDDAQPGRPGLGIALTARGVHAGEPIPMAGVPVHAAEAYLAKLIRAGFKVSVCEQMEDPSEARKRGSKSIVRRDVVRVVTPGTLTEDSLLDARGANRLAAVAFRAGQVAVAASRALPTGEVEVSLGRPRRHGRRRWRRCSNPRSWTARPPVRRARPGGGAEIRRGPGQPLAQAAWPSPPPPRRGSSWLYGVDTLDGFGALNGAEVAALGLIAAHLETTQAGRRPALSPPRRGGEADAMAIDPATRASLEIDRGQSGGREGSLLAAIDRTITSGGARLLASRLNRPLLDTARITARLDAVQWMLDQPEPAPADARGPEGLRRHGPGPVAGWRLGRRPARPRNAACATGF